MKKLLIICCSELSILCLSNNDIYAKSKITNEMSEDTLIKYLNSDEYVIIDGEDKIKYQYNDEQFAELKTQEIVVPNTKVAVEEYPDPCEGLYVQYGSDGLVNKIYTDKGKEVEAKYTLQDKVTTKGVSDPHYFLVAEWGSYPNYLYRGVSNYDYLYYGKGRATTFNDTIGQQDHKLVKGDIATKMEYDNCSYNTRVQVSMPKKNGSIYTRTMYKRDVGGMPNAIVDVWKTGVEYWGYTYTSTLSIGNVTIKHD